MQLSKMAEINLMFHDVYSISAKESGFPGVGPDLYKVDRNAFESFVVATLGKRSDFVFTFDDGGSSAYYIVAPILEKYNKKGIFFIVTSCIGKEGFLSAEQIVDLSKRGHTIGSHSHSHKRLSELSDMEILREWQESKDILSTLLNKSIETASIPNGYQSDSVLVMAEKVGYKALYTSVPTTKTVHKGDIAIIGRFVVTKNTSLLFINKLQSSYFRIYMKLRSCLLMRLRHIMGPYYKRLRDIIFK